MHIYLFVENLPPASEMDEITHPITGRPMPEFLTGVITPMLTAFNEDGSLDEDGIRAMVRWLKSTGAVTTIFARSGVGQMFTFSFDEVKTMIDVSISEAKDEIYVMPGTSGVLPDGRIGPGHDEQLYVSQTVELSKYAERQGATGVVVLPLGLVPSENFADKVFDFYKKVNDSVTIPIVIYQPPGVRPPHAMTPSLLHRLAGLERVVGMKYSTSDMQSFGLLCDATKDQEFTMISGHEGAFLPSLVLGAGAVIGGGCNTHPELIRAIFDAFMKLDLETARRRQFEVSRLLGVRFQAPDPYSGRAVNSQKLYLARKGVKIKPYQRPVTPQASKMDLEALDRAVEEMERAIDEAVSPYRKLRPVQ